MALNVERIQKLPTAQKALIIGGVILLIYVAYYFLWLSKRQETIKKLDADLTKLKQQVAQGEAVRQEIAKFEQIQKDLERKLKEAEKKLPKQAEIPELLEKISDLARGNQLTFTKFQPDLKPVTGGGGMYQQIFISVELSGGYHRIATFLDQVSKLERIINIEKINFSPKGGPEAIGANVKLITYMFGG